MTERWDDWVMTCGEPTVWCGFDWPVMAKSYVVYPDAAAEGERLTAERSGTGEA